MKARTLILLIVLVAIASFAALNWNAFMTPTTLSLGIADIQAPLGMVMLGLMCVLIVFFLIFILYLQTSVLFDTRHHARELRSNRELADQAEASRFTELRSVLEAGLTLQSEAGLASRTALLERMDRTDKDWKAALEQAELSLSASIGELDDRLGRNAGVVNLDKTY
ncbi:LapA family protein [Actimicrobium sp. CCI2.3]|uniref:LapA family protein n=1 Tax=Actimicrobium sp. CCI2.3 TaxID=3048616 RepID=UPI002AB4146E|nr:LapA family protein [Actimicrobium sp. CCI2.3]MDY7573436.1 LapA family protein [Actimicrobium sp. CCI2.3]MEB0022616.1 LapA family protein [Actimicrobium sp. CCI2.3]